MSGAATVLLFAALSLHSPAAAGEPLDAPPRESVRVERAHWPVLIRRAIGRRDPEGRCSSLGPADLELLQGGEPRPVTALGPRPLPRLHALLVDTSHSMQPRLGRAKTAAREYIEALPGEDAVLVASFDESLVLATPATHDRSAALEAVRPLETGYYTSLWDALYYLTLHVETLPGEKVIVVLTDGEDSSSTHSYEEVLELAARVPNLSIFPIGLDLPASINHGIPMARGRLGRMAARTGGELSEIDRISQLASSFRRIQQRLDNRLYVSYIPRLEEQARSEDAQEIKIRVRNGLPCRVESLEARAGLGERRPGVTDDLQSQPPDDRDLVAGDRNAGACLARSGSPTVVRRFALSESGRSGRTASLYTTTDPDVMFGRTTDFVLDQGPLFSRKPSGRLRTVQPLEPVLLDRNIEIATPPLDFVREKLTGPEDLLLFLLERASCAPEPTEQQPYARAPVIVHGKTFLELRGLLGRALFHARADYRRHAIEAAARRADEEVRALLRELPPASEGSGSRDRLAAAVVERASDPGRGRPHLFLAEWLGDVSALDAIRALEQRVANMALADDLDADVERRLDMIASAWHKLDRWFPPAIDARILAPLVPAYDADRDAFGFYRFLLPWPRILGRQPDLLPPRPLALETMRWLTNDSGAESLRLGELSLLSIDYARVRGRKARQACAALEAGTLWRATIELVESSRERRSDPLVIRAYFAAGGVAGGAGEPPACIDVDVPRGASVHLRKAGQGLRDALRGGPGDDS